MELEASSLLLRGSTGSQPFDENSGQNPRYQPVLEADLHPDKRSRSSHQNLATVCCMPCQDHPLVEGEGSGYPETPDSYYLSRNKSLSLLEPWCWFLHGEIT